MTVSIVFLKGKNLLQAGKGPYMDCRGRALNNVFVERLWISVKQEEVYLHDYRDVSEAKDALSAISGGTTRNASISPSTTLRFKWGAIQEGLLTKE